MSLDHTPSDDALPLDLLGLDDFECGLLAVLRHFMTAFARPETQAWQHAYAIATERWGIARGPQVAHGLLAVLQSMRHARDSDFRYANPLCLDCRDLVTGEEAAFCRMMQAMRRDRADLARGAVLELTEGRMDPLLIQSALAFAARFPAQSTTPAAPGITPTHPGQAADRGHGGRTDRATRPSARHLRLVH